MAEDSCTDFERDLSYPNKDKLPPKHNNSVFIALGKPAWMVSGRPNHCFSQDIKLVTCLVLFLSFPILSPLLLTKLP